MYETAAMFDRSIHFVIENWYSIASLFAGLGLGHLVASSIVYRMQENSGSPSKVVVPEVKRPKPIEISPDAPEKTTEQIFKRLGK